MGKKSRKIHDVQVPTGQRSTRSKTHHTAVIQRATRREDGPGILNMAEIPKLVRGNGKEPTADPGKRSQWMHLSVEENVLALLEHSAQADLEEILEDKMMFVEFTYSLCVVPNLAQVPTFRMLQAVLGFIEECFSVGLTVSSFNLLSELEKRHPRVAVRDSTSPDSVGKVELIINEKVWSPLDETCRLLTGPDKQPMTSSSTGVSSNIFVLLEAISRRIMEMSPAKKAEHEGADGSNKDLVIISQYTMLQHLLKLLDTDLRCRLEVYSSGAEKEYSVVRESYLCRLISCLSKPEKQSFITNLTSIICPCAEGIRSEGRKASPLPATREFGRLASNLLVLVMKVDASNQMHGVSSTRGDSLLFETLRNLCTKSNTLDAYLKAVSDPRDKLSFVKDYFVNYAPKPVAQDLGDFSLMEFTEKLLSYVSDCDKKTLISVARVFKEPDSLPLLLSHAFQAYLLLLRSGENAGNGQFQKDLQENRDRICKAVIASLTSVEKVEGDNLLLPTVQQTMFVAKRMSGL